MAERVGGMKSSLSADDVGRPSKKPGKISADLLAQFESDPALSGSSSSLQFPRPSPGHGSSSDMGSASASHEHLAPIKRPNVRISEPEPFGSSEEMAAGIDHDNECDEKTAKKRKSIWKWGPLKKVRKFFSRKKNSRRAKSCEDLPVSGAGFRHVRSQERLEVDESLRCRSTSSPLHHEAEINPKSSPVMRSRSMPPKSPNVLKETSKRQASSHEEIREESSQFPVSKTFSLPTLHNTGIRSLRDVYTEEAAISFDSDPSASSIEGLQAAHDKIKAAPKRRRPPSRSRSHTSSLSNTPAKPLDQKAHKRSKTDPRELTRERTNSGHLLDQSSLSDIMNNTIFEASEVGEEEDAQTTTLPTTLQKDDARNDAVKDDIMSKVNDLLSQTTGPSRLSGRGSPTTRLRAAKVDTKKTEKEELDLEKQEKKEWREPEKRRSFPDKKETGEEEIKCSGTNKETIGSKELSAPEKRSFPATKEPGGVEIKSSGTTKETIGSKELPAPEKRRSFPYKKETGEEETKSSGTTKDTAFVKKELTVPEKRKSFPEKLVAGEEEFTFGRTAIETFEKKERKSSFTEGWKTKETTEKKENLAQEKKNGLTEKKSVTGFSDSIRNTRAETEVVMAEKTCQLESEVTFDDFEFDKILDDKPTPESNKDSKVVPELKEPEKPQSVKPSVPFKRGKSWSNNHKTKLLQEFPFKQDGTSGVAKKETQTNVLTEKRKEHVKDENKLEKASEEKDQNPFQFSRTKSWSYGTKPGDFIKANAKENEKPTMTSNVKKGTEDGKEEPSWVGKANLMSRRISQLLQEDESSENQTPAQTKPNKNNINKSPASKPPISPKPAPKSTEKPLVIEKDPFKVPLKPAKPPVAQKEHVKPTKPAKPLVKDQGKTSPKLKPNSHGRNAATLPPRTDKVTTDISCKIALDKTNRQSLNLPSKDNTNKNTVQELNKKTFGGMKIEKCIICGTNVYQMEKCKFDDSVLHRNCIKCTVCNRHLTVGNFVMTESKIYCKPHSHTVTVST